MAAGAQRRADSQTALAELCQAYWQPLYAFVRFQGRDASDAQDLTQAFFADLLERNYLDRFDADRGRFRTFLLAALKHFMSDQDKRARALKRGGGVTVVPFDPEPLEASGAFSLDPGDHRTPEALFERKWAETLFQQAIEELGKSVEEYGPRQFEILSRFLAAEGEAPRYRELGASLGIQGPAARS